MHYVKERGGTTIVQDPDLAAFPYMPIQAIKKAAVDFVYGPEQIAAFLNNL
jgi:chemotaxis response regulator CheB